MFDVVAMGSDATTRRMVLEKVWPTAMAIKDQVTGTPEQFNVLLDMLKRDVHVRRLQTFWSVMSSLVEPEPDKSAQSADKASPPRQERGGDDLPVPSRQQRDGIAMPGAELGVLPAGDHPAE